MVRRRHVVERGVDVVERRDRNDRPELLLAVQLHPLRHRIDDGRIEQRLAEHAAGFVHDLRAQRLRVVDRVGHVRGAVHARQRRDADALLPRHADLHLRERGREALQEFVDDRAVHEQHLQRGAALPVERQRAEQAFLDGQVEVRIGQHDRRVLRVEPEDCAQPVRLRVLLLQVIGHLARPDQRQHVDLARCEHVRHDHRARRIDRVDHALRERVAECLEQRLEQQRAVLGRLEHDGVAHQQRGDQRREGLVQRVVVRPHAQHDAERRAADLPDRALGDHEARVRVVELLQRIDRLQHVGDGAVELLLRIGEALADLPHDQVHDKLALRNHPLDEILHARDALLDLHRRPLAAAGVVRAHGGVERRVALRLAHHRVAADLELLDAAVGPAHAHRRQHGLARAVPRFQFAVHERHALVDRGVQPDVGGDVFEGGKQLLQGGGIGHDGLA